MSRPTRARYPQATHSVEYNTWVNMRQRCNNPNSPKYADYGGRGIKVCERWQQSFDNFVEDMGRRPEGLTLDRIDVNGDYSPENCRWATRKEQQNNRRLLKGRDPDRAKRSMELLEQLRRMC